MRAKTLLQGADSREHAANQRTRAEISSRRIVGDEERADGPAGFYGVDTDPRVLDCREDETVAIRGSADKAGRNVQLWLSKSSASRARRKLRMPLSCASATDREGCKMTKPLSKKVKRMRAKARKCWGRGRYEEAHAHVDFVLALDRIAHQLGKRRAAPAPQKEK